MHSREKLTKYYPQIDDVLLQQLYGVSSSRNTKEFWNRLVISKLASKFASGGKLSGWEGIGLIMKILKEQSYLKIKRITAVDYH